jgi:hypothetical protein
LKFEIRNFSDRHREKSKNPSDLCVKKVSAGRAVIASPAFFISETVKVFLCYIVYVAHRSAFQQSPQFGAAEFQRWAALLASGEGGFQETSP